MVGALYQGVLTLLVFALVDEPARRLRHPWTPSEQQKRRDQLEGNE